MAVTDDPWSTWLAHERSGGDPARAAAIRAETRGYAERVLRRLALTPGNVVADVGCGEGLVGLAALARPGVRVVFTDASTALVERARTAVEARAALDRASFAVADAATLAPLADTSVDAVVARAAIAYVADKAAAFAAAYRVLRRGGRISIAEPVMRDAAFRLTAVREVARADRDLELLHRWNALALPDTLEGIRAHPLTNFDERTLAQAAGAAGFVDVHVRLHLDESAPQSVPWEVALDTAPVPGTPTLRAALAQCYDAEERARFQQRFRPMFEQGLFPRELRAVAYLWARKSD